MRPTDLVLYLLGHRGAIERVASSKAALAVGAVLVLTAGIARNYDHLDLLRQPEWFLGPFAASLVSIVFIFLWLSGPLRLRKAGHYWRQLGTFVVLAWLTAPCAWLYAIPVESMTDIVTATKWNIAFLVVVAFWRVAVIVRAVSVLTGVSWIRALPLVLAPAALEAMLGSAFQGLSLVGIMGGIRLPPETRLLVEAANLTTTVSFWLLVGSFLASFFIKGVAAKPLYRPSSKTSPTPILAASLAFVVWITIAIPWHPQLANRERLQEAINQRDFARAAAFASGKTRLDFPRHHYLPPEPGQGFPFELLDELSPDSPAWLREEWTHSAIESLKMAIPWNENKWQDLSSKHPAIRQTIELHAKELRERSHELDREDEFWLRTYDRFSLIEPTPPDSGPDPAE